MSEHSIPPGDAEPDKPPMRGNRRVLCHVSEVGEAGKGLTLTRIFKNKPEARLPIFLIPDGAAVRCYLNVCPHQGTPLDLKPDTFLDVDRALIQCSTHGARFRKHDGHCVKGPCVGQTLTKLPVMVDDDGMVLFGA